MMQLGEVETDFTKEINEAFKFFDKDGDGEVRACFACVCPRGTRNCQLGSWLCSWYAVLSILALFTHVSTTMARSLCTPLAARVCQRQRKFTGKVWS